MDTFKKWLNAERQKVNKALSETDAGTEKYDKLLKQREQLEDIERKRLDGTVKPIDLFRFFATTATTAAVVTADLWMPNVTNKLRLTDMINKLVK